MFTPSSRKKGKQNEEEKTTKPCSSRQSII
jgi:hypothetical protein